MIRNRLKQIDPNPHTLMQVYYFVTILRALWLKQNDPEQWKHINQVKILCVPKKIQCVNR